MKRFEFNVYALLKIIILLGFGAFFFNIILTGSIKLYVHPRMEPFIAFFAVIATIISISSARRIFRSSQKRTSRLSIAIFCIPLAVIVFVPPNVPGSSDVSGQAVQLSQQSGQGAAQTGAVSQSSTWGAKELTLQNDTVVVDGGNFVQWMGELSNNLDKYAGKKVEITGFIFKDKGLDHGRFVAARFMMICCTADLQVVGLMCKYGNAASLKKDAWYKVEGIIGKTAYNGSDVPYIAVSTLETAQKPADEYVYPY